MEYLEVMKKTALIILILLSVSDNVYAKNKTVDYKVKSGDNLITIAKRYNTTTKEIIENNNLKENGIIRVGQVLKISTDKKIIKNSTETTKQTIAVSKKGKIEYKVVSGDTLYTIAHSHHCSINDLLKENNISYGETLKLGQTLTVPLNTYNPNSKKKKIEKVAKKSIKADTQNKGEEKYIVKRGDTLYIIAHAHHTTIKEVLEANDMKPDDMIRVGQSLKVPLNTYSPDKAKRISDNIASADPASGMKEKSSKSSNGLYEVKSGDTLFSIARKNHVTLKELMTLNGIKATDVIKVGQKLAITKKKTFIEENKSDNKRKNKAVKIAISTKKYKVKRRDTLRKIAKKYNMSIAKLRKLNHLGKKSKLKKGMVLTVIETPKVKKYKVKKGDTLWLIAKKNNMTLKKLRALNHFTKKDKIHTGMLLSVSGNVSAVPEKKRNIYKVKRGDTWAKIAKRTNISIKKLRKLNHLTKRTRLKKGMVLALNKSSAKKTKTRGRSARSRRARSALAAFGSRSGAGGDYGIIRTAKRYLGRHYVWGAEGPRSFDCSGFTQYVLRKSKGVRLPRVSRKQAYYGKYVSRRNLRAGDLIFFDTSRRRRGYVNHVAIYIGHNKFIHASSARHRVVITSLNKPFYSARFKWGRRVY